MLPRFRTTWRKNNGAAISPRAYPQPMDEQSARDRLDGLATGFMEAKLLLTGVELRLFDLLFLSQVAHAESAERNRDLFSRLAPMLTPGGRLVVHETTVEPDRTGPVEATLFAVNMVAMTDGGRVYTAGEIAAWGEAAGLVCDGWDHLGPRSCIITLRRPEATA